MSLHDAIDDLNDIFFDADGFAESITYVPGGVMANKFLINAVVDWADEEGSNQIRGEGRTNLNRDKGRSVRTSPVVELPMFRMVHGIRTPVTVDESGKDRIIATKHGTRETVTLVVKRIIGRDEAAQSVLCHFVTQHETQTRKTRFG